MIVNVEWLLDANAHMNLVDSGHMPLVLVVGIACVIEGFRQLDEAFRTTELDPGTAVITLQEFVLQTNRMLRIVNQYSALVLNFNETIHSLSFEECILRYNNIIALHREIEVLFDNVQDVISILEQNNVGMYNNIPISYYAVVENMGEDIRVAGNLLVETLRSLEDAIRLADPLFAFLDTLWFE